MFVTAASLTPDRAVEVIAVFVLVNRTGLVGVSIVWKNPHRSLTTTAVELATAVNDDGDHTVAAAVLTKSGATVTGVNAFHSLGGPCA